MELSQEEKERIIADEKLRFETVKSLQTQGGGKCCAGHSCGGGMHGCGLCGSFWKGLILGLALCALLGCLFHQHFNGNQGGRCYYGGSMMHNSESSDPEKK